MRRALRLLLLPLALVWLAGEWFWSCALPSAGNGLERLLRGILWPFERIVDLLEFMVRITHRVTRRIVAPVLPAWRRCAAIFARLEAIARGVGIRVVHRVARVLGSIARPLRWIGRLLHRHVIRPIAPVMRGAWRAVGRAMGSIRSGARRVASATARFLRSIVRGQG